MFGKQRVSKRMSCGGKHWEICLLTLSLSLSRRQIQTDEQTAELCLNDVKLRYRQMSKLPSFV